MQPYSARCMRILLRFWMGAHSLPVVMGRRTGTPGAKRLCQQCEQPAVGDRRHMIFKCPALQGLQDMCCTVCSCLHNARSPAAGGHHWCCTFLMKCFDMDMLA